jgi:hypothetical protein
VSVGIIWNVMRGASGGVSPDVRLGVRLGLSRCVPLGVDGGVRGFDASVRESDRDFRAQDTGRCRFGGNRLIG